MDKFCQLFIVGVIFLTNTVAAQDIRQAINFNDNGTFKIVTFADLHYGEGPATDWGPANDQKSTRVMTDILNWENPDFVVYTGTFIYVGASFELCNLYCRLFL